MPSGGTVWDHEHLAVHLQKPTDEAPGTKMIFPGLAKEGDPREPDLLSRNGEVGRSREAAPARPSQVAVAS
jgi:hypothetical protein